MLDVPASHKRAWRKARVVGSNGTKKIGHLGCNLDGQNENKGVAVKDKGVMGSSAKRANASYRARTRAAMSVMETAGWSCTQGQQGKETNMLELRMHAAMWEVEVDRGTVPKGTVGDENEWQCFALGVDSKEGKCGLPHMLAHVFQLRTLEGPRVMWLLSHVLGARANAARSGAEMRCEEMQQCRERLEEIGANGYTVQGKCPDNVHYQGTQAGESEWKGAYCWNPVLRHSRAST
ncbi:hypothetical protein BGY98DRAFT_937708 [Russula aff. rugulosa BPL654]|nr:hypothetical protein BGY98DRAFT_937708 [Russula aff. rugulosa BPL654]